ncbi:glycosyltransferase [Agarivorans sp. Alg241-V36]|uniref:glycosyltransferase n=1 Tax=Agarivorans sp. Alg241-V36 TaxID=2305992 RepID=UPI0013D3509C|nr:glycosyltransferase [Agarivorans sp. Alg241-V36]
MKKILVITPRFPFPVVGGDKLRIYQICKELSKYYSITLVTLCESKSEMSMVISDTVFDSIHRCFLPKWKSYLSVVSRFILNEPMQVSYYKSRRFQRMVKGLAIDHDVVVPHLIRVSDYVKDLDMPKILEMTDALSLNYKRVSETESYAGLKGLIYRLERKRVERYEKDIPKYFNYVSFISEYDKSFLYSNDSEVCQKVVVSSNGVDITALPYNFVTGSNKLIFIGNMHSAQNFDAAYFFAEKVMPELSKICKFEFHVIGKIPERYEAQLKSLNNVIVTGSVDNVCEYAHGALAAICSVRLGAGVQNKILEYMALGVPTISTSIGLEGLEAQVGQDILIADTVEDFIKHILLLKNDCSYSENIAICAHNYVSNNHSWSSKLQPIVKAVGSIG